jgi:hypothetical protein
MVFAVLAVSRWVEHQTGWSIRKFIKTASRCRLWRSSPASHYRRHRRLAHRPQGSLDQIHSHSAVH